MCIRDRTKADGSVVEFDALLRIDTPGERDYYRNDGILQYVCLLYTSDAADERSSVDLGGRRIIKKKKRVQLRVDCEHK